MSAKRRPSEPDKKPRRRPATTPEAREKQLISLAHDLAEKQIRDGEASSQVITHFLKQGSAREELEQEKLRHENELTKVKIENIAAQSRIEELYKDAIKAMSSYSGNPIVEDELEIEVDE